MIKISVIICTYNSAKCLKKALTSLIDQTLDNNLYEILVVDNNSSDETISQVKSFQHKFSRPVIKLIKELKQGLGYARNRGLKYVQGEYVAFIDDDAKADKHWLENAISLMDDDRLKPVAVGGVILPFYKEKKPDWFKDEYEMRSWGDEERFLKKHESLSGSNMIIRRVEAIKYGGFENKVGMKGSYLSVGEETSLFEKIWRNNKEANVFYSPKLIVYHLVPIYKMTVWYQLKRSLASGNANFLRFHSTHIRTYATCHCEEPRLWGGDEAISRECELEQVERLPRPFGARNDTLNQNLLRKSTHIFKRIAYLILYLVAIFWYLILAIVVFVKYKRYQNWLVEQFSPVFYLLGFESGLLGFPVSLKRK